MQWEPVYWRRKKLIRKKVEVRETDQVKERKEDRVM
jgi:hypothetical protein